MTSGTSRIGSTLTVNGGGLHDLGRNGCTGTLTIQGGATAAIAAGTLALADSIMAGSRGVLNVLSGSAMTAATVTVGSSGGAGTQALLTVEGAGSSFTQGGASTLGVGAMTGSAGAIVVSGGGVYSTGTGTSTVRTTGLIDVAASSTFNANGNLNVNGGRFTGAAGSTLNLATGTMLTVQGGGIFAVDQFNAIGGRNVGVTGAGSTFVANGTATIGSVAGGSSSTFTVDADADVTFNATVSVRATGTVTVNDGTMRANQNFSVFGGTFNQPGGTFILGSGRTFSASSDAQVTFNFFSFNNNTMSVGSGADVTVTGQINLGLGNTGTLNVSGAGSTLSGVGVTIAGSGGTGTLSLSGGAAASFSDSVFIAANSNPGTHTGLLSVGSGSTFTATDDVLIGGGTAGSTGTVTVSGVGSSYVQTGVGNTTSVGDNGGSDGGVGVLNVLDGGTFSTGMALNVLATGVVNVSGGNLNVPSISNGGTLNFNSGTITYGTALTVGPGGPLGSSLTLTPTRNLVLQDTLTVSPASAVILDGGTLTMTNNLITNGGVFQFNSGRLNLPSLELGVTGPFASSLALGANQRLALTGTLRVPVGAQLSIQGGTASANVVTNSGNITVSGGVLSGGTLNNTSGATLNHDAGTLSFTAPSTNATGAALAIGPTATAVFESNLTNSGEIYLGGALATLSAGTTLITMQNNGLIRGDGRVSKPVSNNAGGEIRAEAGKRIRIDVTGAPNAGKVTLLGGTVEFGNLVVNAAGGTIAGRGTLITPSLSNNGTLSLSAGFSDVFGSLTNLNSGKTIVSGNATATFYGSVSNTSGTEFRVSAGATAVFLGSVTGSGLFTGTGTKHFEGGASSPSFLATGGTTVVEGPASLTTSYLRESSLTAYGPTTLAPGSPTSVVASLTLGDGGTLDVTNNWLVVDYAAGFSPVGQVRDYLLDGRLFSGTVDADPLGRMAIGYLDNAVVGMGSWGDVGVDVSSVLTRLTYLGDANLDGVLGRDDFALIDKGLATRAGVWWLGDFNYDGVVTSADYLLLDRVYAQQGGPLSGAILAAREAQFGADYVSQLLVSIPEPSALTAGGVVLGYFGGRRRRG